MLIMDHCLVNNQHTCGLINRLMAWKSLILKELNHRERYSLKAVMLPAKC